MDTFLQDLRYALRTMRRSPGFTTVAALALALGIGANTAIFSVVNTVLLRPLPYDAPQRIGMVWNHWEGWPATWVSEPEYWDIRRYTRTLEHVVAFTDGGRNLTGGDTPERVRIGFATANVFPALGVRPILGRPFSEDEDRRGGPRVAVLSHELWRRRFGADPKIIGASILLNDSSVTVLGVMPPGFQLPLHFSGRPMDLWMPLQLDASNPTGRGGHDLNVVARLAPGATIPQAEGEVVAIAKRMIAEHPNEYSPAFGSFFRPVETEVLGDVRPALFVLAGAVGFVLLIACANVANLLLARSEARQREMAVRTALGAGHGRIVRQLLTESLLLALLGGVLGLALAWWSVEVLRATAPASVPRVGAVTVDARVLLFTLVVALGTGVLFGLVPALHVARTDLQSSLKDGGRGATADARRLRLRRALVVGELALALVLVVGAGLLVRSFARLRAVDPGFAPTGALTMQITLPASRYAEPVRTRDFYRQLIARVRTLPGVRAAGGVRALPMSGPIGDWGFAIAGREQLPNELWSAGDWQVVTPDYFAAMGVRLRGGRMLTDADDERAMPVIMVNEALARRAWKGEDPIGQRVRLGGDADTVWRTVIGVIGDIRSQGLDADVRPEIYLPHYQFPATAGAPQRNLYLVVRASGDPVALAGAVRREVAALDPSIPINSVRPLADVVGAWTAERRLSTSVLTVFSLVALLLAAVGIYGVMAYTVAQRTHEIGIRLALGAQHSEVVGLMVKQGAAMALVGIAIGLAAALALTRLLSGMLYRVSTTDPTTFVGIALVLGAVALMAAWLPARRAARVDPMVALRAE